MNESIRDFGHLIVASFVASGYVQPLSQNSRTQTVTKEFQIGLFDPAEADLELFCNSWSAGFFGERLYTPILSLPRFFSCELSRVAGVTGYFQCLTVLQFSTPDGVGIFSALLLPLLFFFSLFQVLCAE